MRMRAACLLAAIAVALGIASPWLTDLALDAEGYRRPVLYHWFYWLPGQVSYWLWPESDAAFMALGMAVYAVQYLALFGLVWAAARGLVSRRA